MRLIGNLPEQKQAESFVAFLMTTGIQSHLESEGDQFDVWIKDEDRIVEAVSELNDFKANPTDVRYDEALGQARKIQEERIRKRRRIEKNIVHVSNGMGRGRQPLTVLLMVICGLVAILTNFGAAESLEKATFRALAFTAVGPLTEDQIQQRASLGEDSWQVRLASILRGEGWRLVTPIFIHHGVFHLVFNMYWLFLMGSQIENRYGTFWFGMLVLLSAAISNFFQGIVPVNIGGSAPGEIGTWLITLFGGMSGVDYALFGFIWMKMTYERGCGLFLPQSTIFILLAWLVFCMTPLSRELLDLNVANWAHAIGLLVGVIAGYWPSLRKQF